MATKIAKNRVVAEARNGDEPKPAGKVITISAPKFETAVIRIIGTSPYVQNRFGHKAMEMMKAKQMAGSQATKGRKREPKDFMQCYEDAKHISTEGWCGLPASSFRTAMISACRLVDFKMTLAKLSVFVEADGFDRVDGTPLVKLTKGEPKYFEQCVKNDSGVADIRARPQWAPGWEAEVRIRFDADRFSSEDILNLMHRVGQQIGIGEGRPDSRDSCGVGWGVFRVATIDE